MRKVFLLFGLAIAVAAAPLSAFAADTPAAKFTRTKKLKAPVTLNFKDEMLRVIFEEIDGQIADQGLSGLSVRNDVGVSLNQRITYQAEDKPLEEVLDELLSINKLGYIVVSKEGDRYDGWLLITTGGERGYVKGEEPPEGENVAMGTDPEPVPMPMVEPEPEPEPVGPPPRDRQATLERIAEQHYLMALYYQDTNNLAKYRKKLEYILELYPETAAGMVAKELLEGQQP